MNSSLGYQKYYSSGNFLLGLYNFAEQKNGKHSKNLFKHHFNKLADLCRNLDRGQQDFATC